MPSGITPEQQEVIDKVVEAFDQDWEVATVGAGICIRRKSNASDRTHDLFALYWVVQTPVPGGP